MERIQVSRVRNSLNSENWGQCDKYITENDVYRITRRDILRRRSVFY